LKKWIAFLIEAITCIVFVALAVRWAITQNGWFEPYTVICGIVLVCVDLFRRYFDRNEALNKIEGDEERKGSHDTSSPTSSDSLAEKIRHFRDERIELVVANNLPVRLTPHPKTVLHLLPYSALDPNSSIDVSLLEHRSSEFPPLSPYHLRSWGPRYNRNGLLITGNSGDPPVPSTYLQLFRSGVVEAVESMSLRSQHPRDLGLDPIISASAFEGVVIEALKRFLRLLELVEIEPPIVVMLSLVGVKGYRLCIPGHMNGNISTYKIEDDNFLLPIGLIQSYTEPVDKVLQPAFDAIWQSVGYARDTLYQDSGKGNWSSK
jgi:hypothetical protein